MTNVMSIMRKAFDCTLGALWRLYVKMIIDGIFVTDHDLEFADWAFAIAATALFIFAIAVAGLLLLLLVNAIIDFPFLVICIVIGIAVICALPWLALKSYRLSKAKAIAAAVLAATVAAKKSRKTKKGRGFNQ